MKTGVLKMVGYMSYAVTCESICKLYRFVIKAVTTVVTLTDEGYRKILFLIIYTCYKKPSGKHAVLLNLEKKKKECIPIKHILPHKLGK